MPDPRKTTLNAMTVEQSEAQWAADSRVFDVNKMLVPSDGPNQGKHKLADGIRTYAQLSFVDTGIGGTGTINIEGETYSAYGFIRTSGVDGLVTLDLTALIPGVSEVIFGGVVFNSETVQEVAFGSADPTSPLSAYALTITDSALEALADIQVLITIYAK